MLIKLLKYDLKYMLKNMIVFYALSIFFAITTRILLNMNQSIIIDILEKISAGCMFSMVANILINTMMRSWIRFRDSLYKDEAYLTHTLPVTKNDLYNSKFIQTFIFFFIGFAVILLSLFITYYSKNMWIVISNLINDILIIFLETFNIIQCGYLGLILGYNKNNSKIGYSVLFGFIFYLIAQFLVLFLVYIYGLFDSSVMELFKTATINIDVNAFKTLAILSSILYMIIITLTSIICKKILNKGDNID